jgi:hypothetical protein
VESRDMDTVSNRDCVTKLDPINPDAPKTSIFKFLSPDHTSPDSIQYTRE